MNTKSEKEMDAFYKRVEDPTNHSTERWGYLIEQWINHGIKIEEDTGWDDSSAYYSHLISQLEQLYEKPIWDFISLRMSENEKKMKPCCFFKISARVSIPEHNGPVKPIII